MELFVLEGITPTIEGAMRTMYAVLHRGETPEGVFLQNHCKTEEQKDYLEYLIQKYSK